MRINIPEGISANHPKIKGDGHLTHRLHRTFPQLPTNEGVFRFHSFPKQYSKTPIKPRFAGFA